MKDRIASSIFWIVWSRVGLHGLSFLSTLVVVRILTPADYGLMALAGVWIYVLSLVVELDLASAIIQFPDLEESELNACFWLTTVLTLLGCLMLIVAAPHIADWFSAPRLAEILPIVAFALPLAGAKAVPFGLLKKHLEFDKISKAEIVATVVSIVVMLSMAFAGAGVWALVAGALVPMVIQSVGCFWFVTWRPGIRVNGKRVGQMVQYSLRTTGANISWALYMRAPTVVLGKVAGEAALGVYTIAMDIASTLATKITGIVQQLALPVMAQQQQDKLMLRESTLKAFRLVAVITFPLSVGMILVAEDFVFLVLTSKWSAAIPLVKILSIYTLYQSLSFLFPIVLRARYRVAYLFRYSLVLLGLLPIAFFFGVKWFGVIGVASVWVVIYPIVNVWMIREACKEIEVGWAQLWQQMSLVILATLAMALSVMITQIFIVGEDWIMRIIRMCLAVLVGGMSYCTVIFFQDNRVSREVQEVAGWIFRLKKPFELRHFLSPRKKSPK